YEVVKDKASKKTAKKTAAPARAAKKAATVKKAAVAKKTAKKPAAKKVVKKATATKKTATKKTAAKKTATKKTAAKKVAAKVASKKTVKKAAGAGTTKKVPAKSTAARKKAPSRKAAEIEANRGSGSDELIHGITPYRAAKREAYMNQKQLVHFRNILSTWRVELVKEVNRTLHSMQDETVNHPDPNDRATQESDMSLELRSRDRERKLIRKIDSTIALLESGDYGYCDKCGVEIGIARLEARPTATLCVDCKTLDEIREKQMV
ncbi:RNA polymerase-binding protein DksA, partial [Pseudomonadota bacterium]